MYILSKKERKPHVVYNPYWLKKEKAKVHTFVIRDASLAPTFVVLSRGKRTEICIECETDLTRNTQLISFFFV